jgi:hypothetical protein
MSYDPKEVEKWRKVCGSKNPLDYFRKLHEDGKLNKGDIPLIKKHYSFSEGGRKSGYSRRTNQ